MSFERVASINQHKAKKEVRNTWMHLRNLKLIAIMGRCCRLLFCHAYLRRYTHFARGSRHVKGNIYEHVA